VQSDHQDSAAFFQLAFDVFEAFRVVKGLLRGRHRVKQVVVRSRSLPEISVHASSARPKVFQKILK
jgi:hypothetical protein